MTTLTDDQQAQLADRDRAVYAAMFAADHVLINHPEMVALPRVAQARIVAEAVVGYLVGRGLITVTPEAEWPEWMAIDIPEHLEPDVAARLTEWARIRSALPTEV